MDERDLQKKSTEFIASSEAARLYRVTNDYIARLCRQGKLEGVLEGRTWLVKKEALLNFFKDKTPVGSVEEVQVFYLRSQSAAKKSTPVENEEPLTVITHAMPRMMKKLAPAHEIPRIDKKIPSQTIGYGVVAGMFAIMLITFSALAVPSVQTGFNTQSAASPTFATLFNSVTSVPVLISNTFSNLFSRNQNAIATVQNPVAVLPIAPSAPVSLQSTQPISIKSQPIINNYNTYVLPEVQPTVAFNSDFSSQLNQAINQLRSEIYSTPGTFRSEGGLQNSIALTQIIDSLNDVTITNGTVHGLSGLTTSDIPDLSSSYLSLSGGTINGILTLASTTATSTFAGGIDVTGGCLAIDGGCLSAGSLTNYWTSDGTHLFNNVDTFIGIGTSSPYAALSVVGASGVVADLYTATSTATSTFAGGISTNLLNVISSTASSTFGNGINLLSGCFAINGNCLSTGGGSGTPGGADTQVQFNDGGSFGGDSGLTYNKTADRLTTTYASSTGISSTYASSTLGFFGSLSIGNLSGFLKATAGAVSTATIDLVNDVGSSILAVVNGGTGWGNIQANSILLGNGTNKLSTTTAGTNGQVLALVNGIPTWQSTTTLATINGSLNLGTQVSSTLGVGNGGTGLSSLTGNRLLYTDSSGSNFVQVATSSLSFTGPFVVPSTLGNLIGGSNTTILYTGLATTSQPSSSNILVSNGTSGVYGVATTSASCSGSVSCSQFTILGSSPVTITGSASGGSGTISTSTVEVAGQVPYFDTNAGTPTKIGGNAGFTFASTSQRLTVTYASSTGISSTYASSTQGFFGSLSISNFTGVLKATAGSVVTTLIDLTSDITGILGVGNGGTGWSAIQTGAVLFGNGSNALSTTTAGTNGQVLALVNGIPTWQSTTTLSNISGTLGIANGGTNASSFNTNTLLFYDGTRFVSTSTAPLYVGSLVATSTATSTFSNIGSASGNLTIGSSGTSNFLLLNPYGGNVGVGSSTPYHALSIVGTTTATGGFNVDANQNLLSYLGSTTISILGTRNFFAGQGANGSTTKATGSDNVFVGQNAGTAVTSNQNIFIGSGSGMGSTTGAAMSGTSNTAVGYQTLKVNSTGASNAAFGNLALTSNTTGSSNAAFGSGALTSNTTASFLSAFGINALAANTTGSGNSAFGSFVLGSNITGSFNTAVGQTALLSSTGNSNTTLGYQAGRTITSGNANILLGAHTSTASVLTTGSGNIGLGNELYFASSTADNQLNIGNFLYGTLPATSTAFLLPTTGNLGIASSSQSALLAVHANNGATYQTLFAIGSSTASATTTLFSISNTGALSLASGNASIDASGNLTVASCSGCGGGGTPGGSSNQIQFNNAGSSFGGASNFVYLSGPGLVGIGTTTPQWALEIASSTGPQLALSDGSATSPQWTFRNAGGNLYIASSSPSTFATSTLAALSIINGNLTTTYDASINGIIVGRGAGGITTNTALGNSALSINTTANNNTAIGYHTLQLNISGSNNTALGALALSANYAGSDNTAIGKGALSSWGASQSVAVGSGALSNLLSTTTGNIAIGYAAGQGGSGGHFNYATLVGYQAGINIDDGSSNILIGSNPDDCFQCGFSGSLTSGYGNIGIGNNIWFPSAGTNTMLNIGNLLFGSIPATTSSGRLTYPTTGKFGIASTSQSSLFALHANNGATYSTLFAIGSSTASATSTLFSISNTGTTTIANGVEILGGCFKVNGSCLSTSGGSTPGGSDTQIQFNDGSTFNGASNFVYLKTSGLVGIGTTSPVNRLDVGGFINTDKFSGYKLDNLLLGYASTTNGATIFGLQAGGNNATTSATVSGTLAVGYQALASLTVGTNNTALGYQTLTLATSSQSNTAVGYQALKGTGSGVFSFFGGNTAVGALALTSNSTGFRNTAIGSNALGSVTTGTNNTAVGLQAGFRNSTGSFNTSIGSFAGQGVSGKSQKGNTSIGYFAGGQLDDSGDYNVLVGAAAGFNLTNGYGNILVGSDINTINNLSTGFNNIAIGYETSFPSGTANNQLNIGNFLYGTLPATTSVFKYPTTGNFGIASSSQSALLAVHANNGATYQTLFAVGSSTANATTTLFSISNTGTTTASNGFNITGGCFSVNSVCLSSGGSTNLSGLSDVNIPAPVNGDILKYDSVTGKWINAATSTLGLGGSGAVDSVSNSDGTLTISPTTGAVVASINLSHANTWTALQQFSRASSTQISAYNALYVGTTGTTTILGTATSTFGAGISATYLNLTGTSATSTFANGVDLSAGCFSIRGACLSTGGSGTPGGSSTQVQFNDGSSFNGASNLVYIKGPGLVGIGTTTPRFALQVASSTGPQLALSDGSLTSDIWTWRNSNGTLFIATSSAGTFATTTNAALFIDTKNIGAVAYNVQNASATTTLNTAFNIMNAFWTDKNGSTTITDLYTGAINFDIDAGTISAMNLPIGAAANNTAESYAFNIAASSTANLYIYGQSDGSGGVKNQRVGVGTSTPWTAFAVNGRVSFKNLTGSTGAGSLCLTSDNEVVYNNASDACQASVRAVKHDINNLEIPGLDELNALQTVSFIYNWDTSSTTRYGFIAEDVAAVDSHLGTYDAQGNISGVDDRALIALVVKAFQEFQSTLAQQIGDILADAGNGIKDIYANVFHAKEVDTEKLCVGDVCVTQEQFLAMVQAAGVESVGTSASVSDSSEISNTDTSNAETPILSVNGNNPAQINKGTTYSDLGVTIISPDTDKNLGVDVFVDGGATTTVDKIVIDTVTPGTHTILYSLTGHSGLTGTAQRTVIVSDSASSTATSTTP